MPRHKKPIDFIKKNGNIQQVISDVSVKIFQQHPITIGIPEVFEELTHSQMTTPGGITQCIAVHHIFQREQAIIF